MLAAHSVQSAENQSNVVISRLVPEVFDKVADLLATTMAGNPVNTVVFRSAGRHALAKQREMFRFLLARPGYVVYTASIDGHIVGVMCYATSVSCQLDPVAELPSVWSLALLLGMTLIPVLKWQSVWKRHDPKTSHIHFGPLAVSTEYQGRGIGSSLLDLFCRHADQTHQLCYLETDKQENLPLYERFGFHVVATGMVLGVRCWYMIRKLNH